MQRPFCLHGTEIPFDEGPPTPIDVHMVGKTDWGIVAHFIGKSVGNLVKRILFIVHLAL